jgi:glycosyltransferase involved in cell wall biosynthesis
MKPASRRVLEHSGSRRSVRTELEIHPEDPGVDVSIIITTKNSAHALAEAMTAALGQSVKSEIIVVDSGSTDGTLQILERFGCKPIQGGFERSSQRNLAARVANGKWLLILDADMVLDPSTVERCLTAVDADTNVAVVIPQIAQGEGWLTRARALEKLCYARDPLLEAPRFLSREVFLSIGGYDEHLHAAEDWDIALRLSLAGVRFKRIEGAIVHLDGRTTLSAVFRRMIYYEPSLSLYRAKHPEVAKKQLAPLRPALIRNWRMLLRHPVLALGICVLKTTELTALLWSVARCSLAVRRTPKESSR